MDDFSDQINRIGTYDEAMEIAARIIRTQDSKVPPASFHINNAPDFATWINLICRKHQKTSPAR